MKSLWRGIVRAIICLGLSLTVLHATAASRDQTKEKTFADALAKAHPDMVDVLSKATDAMDKGDNATAVTLYGKVVEAAPDFDPALRRLGRALVELGQRPSGFSYLRKAIEVNHSSANCASMAWAHLLPKSGQSAPDADDLAEAEKWIQEAIKLPEGNDVDNYGLAAQIAFSSQRQGDFRQIVETMRQHFPTEMSTLYYSAIEHATSEEWIRAERDILKARDKGLAEAVVQRFLDSGVHSKASTWKIGVVGGGLIAVWLVGLVFLILLGFLLSKLTLRSAQATDPNVKLNAREQTLRKVYRAVIRIAGFYYYISLPVVLFFVVAVSGGIIYLTLAAGFIAIKLTIILVIGALATIYAVIKSFFIKVDKSEPGRALKRDEAPGLWLLTEEVAGAIGTRPIDEIRILPGVNLAVYERGSWREKTSDRAKRVLLLGAAILNDFKQDDFRCVLAHEYGHFSHRDTAGGEVAIRVKGDMMRFYFAMLQSGQATKLNLAFQFLRLYHFIFRRVSHGATRLQEILADRVAAQTYGAAAFEGGLKHVIWRSAEFSYTANKEIEEAIKSRLPLQAIYQASARGTESVEAKFKEALAAKTTDDDTHPAPADRFALLKDVRPPTQAVREGFVWDLFLSPHEVKNEMLTAIEKDIRQHRKAGDPNLRIQRK